MVSVVVEKVAVDTPLIVKLPVKAAAVILVPPTVVGSTVAVTPVSLDTELIAVAFAMLLALFRLEELVSEVATEAGTDTPLMSKSPVDKAAGVLVAWIDVNDAKLPIPISLVCTEPIDIVMVLP